VSPSLRERLLIDVAAQQVRVRRYSRGWRPRLLAEHQAAVQQPGAEGVASALADLLPQANGQAAVAEVVLSSEWVRFAVLDSASALRGDTERQAAAKHALRRVFGDSAEGWRIGASISGPDSLVAAGIEQDLFDRIEQAMASERTTLLSVRPSLAVGFNRCRRWLVGKPAWFVLVESDRALQCFSDGKQLRSIRSHRVRRDIASDLHDWLEQGRLVDGLAEEQAELVIAYSGTPAPDLSALAPRPVRLIDLGLAN